MVQEFYNLPIWQCFKAKGRTMMKVEEIYPEFSDNPINAIDIQGATRGQTSYISMERLCVICDIQGNLAK